MKTIKSIYLIVFLLVAGTVFAENKKPGALVRSTLKGLEYRIKAGVNIGGTSPLPLPAEIREINSYRPGAQLARHFPNTRPVPSFDKVRKAIRTAIFPRHSSNYNPTDRQK